MISASVVNLLYKKKDAKYENPIVNLDLTSLYVFHGVYSNPTFEIPTVPARKTTIIVSNITLFKIFKSIPSKFI